MIGDLLISHKPPLAPLWLQNLPVAVDVESSTPIKDVYFFPRGEWDKFDKLPPSTGVPIGRLMAKRPKTVGHRFTEALLRGHLDEVSIVPMITCLSLPNEQDASVCFFHELVYI